MINNNQDSKNEENSSRTQFNPSQTGSQNASTDEKDEKIKNEPDTARLRSEKQSVKDGTNKE